MNLQSILKVLCLSCMLYSVQTASAVNDDIYYSSSDDSESKSDSRGMSRKEKREQRRAERRERRESRKEEKNNDNSSLEFVQTSTPVEQKNDVNTEEPCENSEPIIEAEETNEVSEQNEAVNTDAINTQTDNSYSTNYGDEQPTSVKTPSKSSSKDNGVNGFVIVIGVLIALFILYLFARPKKCPKCGKRGKLYRVNEDILGQSKSKTTGQSFYDKEEKKVKSESNTVHYYKKRITVRCSHCGYEYTYSTEEEL